MRDETFLTKKTLEKSQNIQTSHLSILFPSLILRHTRNTQTGLKVTRRFGKLQATNFKGTTNDSAREGKKRNETERNDVSRSFRLVGFTDGPPIGKDPGNSHFAAFCAARYVP